MCRSYFGSPHPHKADIALTIFLAYSAHYNFQQLLFWKSVCCMQENSLIFSTFGRSWKIWEVLLWATKTTVLFLLYVSTTIAILWDIWLCLAWHEFHFLCNKWKQKTWFPSAQHPQLKLDFKKNSTPTELLNKEPILKSAQLPLWHLWIAKQLRSKIFPKYWDPLKICPLLFLRQEGLGSGILYSGCGFWAAMSILAHMHIREVEYSTPQICQILPLMQRKEWIGFLWSDHIQFTSVLQLFPTGQQVFLSGFQIAWYISTSIIKIRLLQFVWSLFKRVGDITGWLEDFITWHV